MILLSYLATLVFLTVEDKSKGNALFLDLVFLVEVLNLETSLISLTLLVKEFICYLKSDNGVTIDLSGFELNSS